MFDKLENVEKRYEELNTQISDPAVIANQGEWKKLMKEHADMEEVVLKYREYKKVVNSIEDLKEMLNDKEMHDLAQAELDENREKLPKIEEERYRRMQHPGRRQHQPDPRCGKSVFRDAKLIR